MPTTKVPASRMIDHNIGSYCFRNKIINGDMRIDQRNAGGTFTLTANSALYGSCDRWLLWCTGSNITYQRVAGNSFGQPFPYAAIRLTGSTGNTNANINQRIEAANMSDIAGKTVTASFRVVSNTTLTNCYIGQYYAVGNDNWTSGTPLQAYSFTSTTTPTTITQTFTLDINTQNGYQFIIGVSGLGAGQTIDITNVQLEVGPTATPFEYRPIGTELALCQRYYCREGLMTGQSTLLNRAMCYTGSNSIFFSSKYPVTMRTAPLVTVNLDRTDTTPFTTNSTVVAADGVDSYSDRFFVRWYTSMAAGQYLDLNGYTADAEL